MQQYLSMMRHVQGSAAIRKEDRTGTGTLSVFGHQMRFDLEQGIPAGHDQEAASAKSIVHELLWFLSGDSNVRLPARRTASRIWNEWADDEPVSSVRFTAYSGAAGARLRTAASIDQIADSDARRLRDRPRIRDGMLVSAWNVAPTSTEMALPPCHTLFQFYVADGKLSCQLYQRSCDIFLGVPFNIASYALLTHMFAQQADLSVGDFVWTGGDCHLYLNHLEQTDEQLTREPLPLPRLAIKRRPDSIFDYRFEDFEILNYESHPHIAGKVAV